MSLSDQMDLVKSKSSSGHKSGTGIENLLDNRQKQGSVFTSNYSISLEHSLSKDALKSESNKQSSNLKSQNHLPSPIEVISLPPPEPQNAARPVPSQGVVVQSKQGKKKHRRPKAGATSNCLDALDLNISPLNNHFSDWENIKGLMELEKKRRNQQEAEPQNGYGRTQLYSSSENENIDAPRNQRVRQMSLFAGRKPSPATTQFGIKDGFLLNQSQSNVNNSPQTLRSGLSSAYFRVPQNFNEDQLSRQDGLPEGLSYTRGEIWYGSVEPIKRAAKSEERMRPTLLRFFQEDEVVSETASLEFSQDGIDIVKRASSQLGLSFQALITQKEFRSQVRLDKMLTDVQLIQIKALNQSCMRGGNQVNYFSLILRDTLNIINFFLETPSYQLIQSGYLYEILQKYETTRNELSKQISVAQLKDTEEETKGEDIGALPSQVKSLSQTEIVILKKIYSLLKYQFSKFVRMLNYSNKLRSGWRGLKLKMELHQDQNNRSGIRGSQHSKVQPHVKKIIEQHRNYDMPISKKPKLNLRSFTVDEKKMNRHRAIALNQGSCKSLTLQEQSEFLDAMLEFPYESKVKIIQNAHISLVQRWKDQYDQDRQLNAPATLCRICNRMVFADRIETHNQACQQRIEKVSEQRPIDGALSALSTEATEVLLQLEKMMLKTPSALGGHKAQPLLQTPTLQRRILMLNQSRENINNIDIGTNKLLMTPQTRVNARTLTKDSQMNNILAYKFDRLKKDNKGKPDVPKLNPLMAYAVNQNKTPVRQEGSKKSMFTASPIENMNESSDEEDHKTEVPNIESRFEHSAKMQTDKSGQRSEADKSFGFDHFEVNNTTRQQRREQCLLLKQNVQSIMDLKDSSMASEQPSTSNAFTIQLKNYARHVQTKPSTRQAQEKRRLEEKFSQMIEGTKKTVPQLEKQIEHRKGESLQPTQKSPQPQKLQKGQTSKDLFSDQKQQTFTFDDRFNEFDIENKDVYYRNKSHKQRTDSVAELTPAQRVMMNIKQKISDNKLDGFSSSLLDSSSSAVPKSDRKIMHYELEIIEGLKNMLQTFYDMGQIHHSFQQQIIILMQYQKCLEQLLERKVQLSFQDVSSVFIRKVLDTLNKKMDFLNQLKEIDQKFIKTLPINEVKEMASGLKVHEIAIEKFKRSANVFNSMISAQNNISSYNSPRTTPHVSKEPAIEQKRSMTGSFYSIDASASSRRESIVSDKRAKYKKYNKHSGETLFSGTVQESEIYKNESQSALFFSNNCFINEEFKNQNQSIESKDLWTENQSSQPKMKENQDGGQEIIFARPNKEKSQFQKSKFHFQKSSSMEDEDSMMDSLSEGGPRGSDKEKKQTPLIQNSSSSNCEYEVGDEDDVKVNLEMMQDFSSPTKKFPINEFPGSQQISRNFNLDTSYENLELSDVSSDDKTPENSNFASSQFSSFQTVLKEVQTKDAQKKLENPLAKQQFRIVSGKPIDQQHSTQRQNSIIKKDLKSQQVQKFNTMNDGPQNQIQVAKPVKLGQEMDANIETQAYTPFDQGLNSFNPKDNNLRSIGFRRRAKKKTIRSSLERYYKKYKQTNDEVGCLRREPRLPKEKTMDTDVLMSGRDSMKINNKLFMQKLVSEPSSEESSLSSFKDTNQESVSVSPETPLKSQSLAQSKGTKFQFTNLKCDEGGILQKQIRKYSSNKLKRQDLQIAQIPKEEQKQSQDKIDQKFEKIVLSKVQEKPAELNMSGETNDIPVCLPALKLYSFCKQSKGNLESDEYGESSNKHLIQKSTSLSEIKKQITFSLGKIQTINNIAANQSMSIKLKRQLQVKSKSDQENHSQLLQAKRLVLSEQLLPAGIVLSSDQKKVINHNLRDKWKVLKMKSLNILKLREKQEKKKKKLKNLAQNQVDFNLDSSMLEKILHESMNKRSNSLSNQPNSLIFQSQKNQTSSHNNELNLTQDKSIWHGDNFESEEISESDSESSMKIPKPGDIKFNSLHAILPSEKKSCALDYENNRKVTINDFVLMKVLAAGAYGKVILSRKKNTKDLFAIKVLEIQKMRAKNCEETIMNEKMILSELNTDFITRGVYTFKSNKYLYMVMEFMKGGDMENLLKEAGYLDQDMARYYIAQMVLALEQLHLGGVIHRDLKPDNILIDKIGHIKLTDFGLSEAGTKEMLNNMNTKVGVSPEELLDDMPSPPLRRIATKQEIKEQKTKKNKVVGTADYIAPEILREEEHTFRIDFWALGIIAYELMTGGLPFNDQTPEKIFKNILRRQITYPPIGEDEGMISQDAHDFIEDLLVSEPMDRLGSEGIEEVKSHKFFKTINWETLMQEPAPFIPFGNDLDATYFPKAKEIGEGLQDILEDQKTFSINRDKDFQNFESICFYTLSTINAQKAKEVIRRAKKKAAKK